MILEYLFILIIVGLMSFISFFSRENEHVSLKEYMFLMLVLITLLLFFHYSSINKYYKQGQIDAINGKIKYEQMIDTIKVWKEKP